MKKKLIYSATAFGLAAAAYFDLEKKINTTDGVAYRL